MSVDAKYTTDRCANCDHARVISQPQVVSCGYWFTRLYSKGLCNDYLHDVLVYVDGLCSNYKRRDV
jgi:hypothetical protein